MLAWVSRNENWSHFCKSITCVLTNTDTVLMFGFSVRSKLCWYKLSEDPSISLTVHSIIPSTVLSLNMIRTWYSIICLCLELLGYDVDKLPVIHQQESDGIGMSGVLTKKKRVSDSGSESDWDYLLQSAHHRALGHGLACLLGLQPVEAVGPSFSPPPVPQINTSAILFNSIPLILFTLHLLYEVCTVISPSP
jgi:hypothetical protein